MIDFENSNLTDFCDSVETEDKMYRYHLMFEESNCKDYIRNFKIDKKVPSVPIGENLLINDLLSKHRALSRTSDLQRGTKL